MPATERTRVDEILAALANPTRRRMLDLLYEYERLPAGAIASRFDMARPSVSEHLRVLRDAGLVSNVKEGRERIYRLEPAPFMELQDWLTRYERFWRGRLDNLRALLSEERDG